MDDLTTKMCLMGVGMATASYDVFAINLVLLILKNLYTISSFESSVISTSALLGMATGQALFGWVGDRIGRQRSAVLTCSLLIVGALGSALGAWGFGGSVLTLALTLSAWRFLLGIGVGGEYPVTAIFTSESSSSSPGGRKRGTNIAAVFSSQGIGNLCASVVMLVVLAVLPQDRLQYAWRLALLLGAIPAALMLAPRCFLTESAAFQKANQQQPPPPPPTPGFVDDDLEKLSINNAVASAAAAAASASAAKPSFLLIVSLYWRQLVGTAGCWLVFDVVFYGNSLFTSTLLDLAGLANEPGWVGIADNVAFNVVIALIALPGYWLAVLLVDVVGRRPLQLTGFAMMAVIYILMGTTYTTLQRYPIVFVVLYGFSYLFANAGPNTTTFILPTESFPTVVRSTCHGFSAASGKLGAVVGSFLMNPIMAAIGVGQTLVLCGALAILGFVLTYFFVPETKDLDMNELDQQYEKMLLESKASQIMHEDSSLIC